MRIFAVGDLHLSKSGEKPMDIFGSAWENHEMRLSDEWNKKITNDDVVLIPGDLSWAMKLDEAYEDLHDVMLLPGKKVFIKGNHDYWWNSISKVRDKFSEFPDAYFLQHDSVVIGGIAIAGTRGWLCPGSTEFKKDKDTYYYNREVLRCEMALSSMPENMPKILMLHYPPFADTNVQTGFCELAERYRVNNVVYGHLHGCSVRQGFSGERNGVRYDLCSLDAIGFVPKEIMIRQ